MIKADQNNHRSYHIPSRYFTLKYLYHDVERSNFDRGMDYLVYHSAKCREVYLLMCRMYLKHEKTKNIAKGLVAAERAMKICSRSDVAQIKKWVVNVQKEVTPDLRKEMETLRREDYPVGKKLRKKAFETLQKNGDFPKEWKFEKPEEKGQDVRLEGPAWWFNPAMLGSVVMAENAPSEEVFVQKWPDGKPLDKKESTQLVKLMLDEHKLRTLLERKQDRQ